jgi:DNA-binding NarL/FixJ family response regulator
MIRIAVVDDHPALRTGLETALRSEPGLVPVGSAGGSGEFWPLLRSARPDLVLLDYHLPAGEDGLRLCRRIKSEALAPRVILYSAYAGGELAIPAALAGADGVIGKGVPARELFEAIRAVAGGRRVLPPISPALLEDAARRLDDEDLPLLGMLLDGTLPVEAGEVLGLAPEVVNRRVDRMIGRLRLELPTPEAA